MDFDTVLGTYLITMTLYGLYQLVLLCRIISKI